MSVPALILLERLAIDTWERLTDAHALNISLGEESITDLNLLEMRRAGLPEVTAIKVPKHREAQTGIDWDWWIGSDECGWLRYVVQAKKLDLWSRRYSKLRYKVSDGHSPSLQFDRLAQFAGATGAVPIYCLYNGGVPMPSPHIRYSATDVRQYGCTVAGLATIEPVHAAYHRKHFDDLHQPNGAFPWQCLVLHHCQWLRTGPDSGKHPLVPGSVDGREYQPRRFERTPPAIQQLVSGEAEELPAEFYPQDLPPPKRVAVIDVSEAPRD
jgi:hypothetical protein